MLKYLQQPLKNFQKNIKKAKALVEIYDVLENLSKGRYTKVFDKLQKLSEDFSKQIGIDIEDQIQEQIDEYVKDENKKKTVEKKGKKFVEFIEKQMEGVKKFFNNVKLVKEEVFLDQALVITISAMEVFLKDSAILLLNRNQELHEKFKTEIKDKLNYQTLKDNKYNLKNSIGNLLFEDKTFFNVNNIKDIYKNILAKKKNIFPDGKMKSKIHKYIETRHLIVHRNSIINNRYKERTGIKKKKGTKYVSTSKQVTDAIATIDAFINHLYKLIRS